MKLNREQRKLSDVSPEKNTPVILCLWKRSHQCLKLCSDLPIQTNSSISRQFLQM